MNPDKYESLVIKTIIGEIEKNMPVNDETLYVSKIYSLFRKLADNPHDEKIMDEVKKDIDNRIIKVIEILEEYEQKRPPEDAENIHYNLLDAFARYYEGLSHFNEYLHNQDEGNIMNAFEFIHQADQLIFDIEDSINLSIEENPIATIL